MKKRTKNLLAMSMVLGLAVCANTVAVAASEENEPVTLTYWYWADDSEASAVVQGMVEDYNNTNGKNITVVAEEYPYESGNFTDNVFNAIMGGGGPDVSSFKIHACKLFEANGLLPDLTEYVDNCEESSQITDSIWDMMREATGTEEIKVLPYTMENLFVYYRPSYFEMAGIEVPDNFTEFLEAIEKCTMDTDGDGKTDIYGFGMRGAGGGQEQLGMFLYPFGADWSDLTTPEAVEAYEAYLNIYKSGYTPESAPNAAYAELVDGFQSGLTAMIIHHCGSSSIWEEAFGDDIGCFAVPGTELGRWTSAGDTLFGIFENCENKDAAFDFYKYMVFGDGGTTWFKNYGKSLGTTDNIISTEEFQNSPFQAVAAESAAFAGCLPPTDTLSEFINNVWQPTNQQALLGVITAEEALQIMQDSLWGE